MLDEVSYIFKVIFNKKHAKLIFRELVSHWNFVSSQWVVPNEIYYALDKHDVETAQILLDKQKEFWDPDDLAIVRAQSFIDMEG